MKSKNNINYIVYGVSIISFLSFFSTTVSANEMTEKNNFNVDTQNEKADETNYSDYKITYMSNGSEYQTSVYRPGENLVPPATPNTPEGYTYFLEWVDKEGNPVKFDSPVAESQTYYAKFSKMYTVDFLDTKGNIVDTKEFLPTDTVTETTKNIAADDGTNVKYWYIQGDKNKTPFPFGLTTPKKNMTLVPEVTRGCTITFLSSGTQIPPIAVDYGDKIDNPSIPQRNGYKFKYWSAQPNGEAFDFSTPINENQILYAVWEPQMVNYKVVFWSEKDNLPGDNGELDPGTNSQNYQYLGQSNNLQGLAGQNISIDSNKASSLINSIGINDKLKYFEYRYSTETTLSGNGDALINVYYKKRVYNYAFNINNSNFKIVKNGKTYVNGGPMYTFKAKYNEELGDRWLGYEDLVPINSFVNQYWNQTTSDLIDTTNRAGVPDQRKMIDSAVVPEKDPTVNTIVFTLAYQLGTPQYSRYLYAFQVDGTGDIQYQNNSYEIKWDRKTASSRNLSAISFDGYTSPASYIIQPNGDRIFYYNANNYKLQYEVGAGSFTGEGQTLIRHPEDSITRPSDPTREGYIFDGWYIDDNYQEKVDFDNIKMPTRNLKLFAKWSANKATVTYLDDFEGQEVATQHYGIGDDVTFPDRYVENKTYQENKGIFLGWYWLIGSVYVDYYDTIPVSSDRVLFARWQTNDYKVSYDLNGGSGKVPIDNNSYKLGSKTIATDDNFSAPKGMVFIGWKSSDEDNKVYYPGSLVPVKGNIKLIAYYVPESEASKITYRDQLNKISFYVKKNEATQLAGEIFTKENYQLSGWSNIENGAQKYQINQDGFVPNQANVDLYAVWIPKKVNIDFESSSGGKVIGDNQVTVNAGSEWKNIKLPTAISDFGYEFDGWTPKIPKDSDKISSNQTFIANFKKNTEADDSVPVKRLSSVTLEYRSEQGDKIADSKIISGYVGDEYNVNSDILPIKGYTFKNIIGLAEDSYANELKVITFVYTRNKNSTDNQDKTNTQINNQTSEHNDNRLPDIQPNNKVNFREHLNLINKASTGQNLNEQLPQTGEKKSYIISLIGAGIIATLISVLDIKRTKKR